MNLDWGILVNQKSSKDGALSKGNVILKENRSTDYTRYTPLKTPHPVSSATPILAEIQIRPPDFGPFCQLLRLIIAV